MTLRLDDLDEATRALMIEEIRLDVAANKLYTSRRFTDQGVADYTEILLEASADRDDSWLASQLRQSGRLKDVETRTSKTGKVTTAQVPITAADTFAEGEFNRFYIRGVCRKALASGEDEVEIYRAKSAERPRPESESRIGARISAKELLNDLRENVGVETALKVPGGPNSGLSVRRIHN